MKYAYVITEGRFRNKLLDERIVFVFSTLQKAMRQIDAIKSLVAKDEWFMKRENSFQRCVKDVDNSALYTRCGAVHILCLRDIIIQTQNGDVIYTLSRHEMDNLFLGD